ncbi:MAG: hypothetical protein HYW04_11525, partial [Deltaproteobacteria bacterium]|nr:hypothetical protein [Deltaproteobacteria bacterium]
MSGAVYKGFSKEESATAVRVLSAGAVKPALLRLVDGFRRESGHDVKIVFATAPAIRDRIGSG